MKIVHTNAIEQDFGIIEALRTALTALERGFALDSPLDPLFRAAVEMLSLLAVKIQRNNSELKDTVLRDPVFDVKPALQGRQLHRNWFDNSMDWIPDPLIDFRDEAIVLDPVTGNEEVLISSNPKYLRKRLPDLKLKDPTEAVKLLWDIAEFLTSMVRGGDWKSSVPGYLYKPDTEQPKPSPRISPEGKRVGGPIGYHRRRRLLQKRQRHGK